MKMNRTLYRFFLVVSFLALNGLLIFGISAVWSYLNTGADRATILHLPEELSAAYLPKVVWTPLQNEGRPMEKQTLSEIERDYLKAWYVRNNALENNNPYGLADYYTDKALTKLKGILNINKTQGISFKTTTLEHHPTLEFYSADGKIAVITEKNVTQYEEAYKEGVIISKHKRTASYKILFLLEDGFWRIRHLVEIPKSNQIQTDNSKINKEVGSLKGVKYYPKKTPWNMFGENFNYKSIKTDFKLLKKLGLNAIRIFVPYESFGKATVAAEKLQQLESTLDIAAENNLSVTVTLFDFYEDYSIKDWTLNHRHAEQIVTKLKDHRALLAWDIKNEPDLDFESRGKETVLAWLAEMTNQIKTWNPEHPVTIGWSTPEAAKNLAQELDVVSFHYCREPAKFLEAYKTLLKEVPDKPIVLQEYGYSSYNGLWNAYLGSEINQVDYFEQMQTHLKTYGISYYFWTLYDFENIPNAVVGKLPSRKGKQKHFGIIDADGKPKKTYQDIFNEK